MSVATFSAEAGSSQGALFSFVRALAAELSEGKVDLPSVPDVVTRLQRALAEENVTNDTVVRLVGAEPALAGRLMTIANSAALNVTGRAIPDLRSAVGRVGFNIVRSAAMSFAVEQLKLAKEFRGLEKPLDGLWRRCVTIGALAHVVAKRFTSLNADAALLAGVLSCVGRMYILTRTQRHPELFADQLAYQTVVRDWHSNVAKAILENWKLPEEIVLAVADHEDPDRDARGPLTLTDVMAVAALLASFSGENDLAHCAAPLLKPMKRMQLELAQCQAVIAESAEDVATLCAALGAKSIART
jgi:HD-like signal output (HDOD) protein